MSLDGGNKAPEIKSTPVTPEAARALNLAEADPARGEEALLANQLGRQVDAALARKWNEGPAESDAG